VRADGESFDQQPGFDVAATRFAVERDSAVAARVSESVREISVAVVNYNTRELLDRCLASAVGEHPAEIIAIDNASTDDSPALVRTRYAQVRLLANRSNRGYGAGVNQAMRVARTRYVFVLNADTELLPGAVRAACDYMDAHPRVGLLGPLLRDTCGDMQQSYFPFPGTLGWLIENDPLGPFAGALGPARRRMLRYTRPIAPRAVPWVLGAAMVIRRDAWQAVGGFDESYYMYFEEVDFCLRLKHGGWEVHYVPDAEVMHVGGASTTQRRTAMAASHFTSMVRFHRRHYEGARLRFWMALMRTKVGLRLARDDWRARFASDPESRTAAEERAAAWRMILFGRARP
jgi:GT2 family glycosyltransferase